MICDPGADPLLFYNGVISIVPASAVLVAIEVKSDLKESTLKDIIDKSSDAKGRAECFTAGFCFDSSKEKTFAQRARRYLHAVSPKDPVRVPDLICASEQHFFWREKDNNLTIYEQDGQSSVETLVRALYGYLYSGNSSASSEVPCRKDVFPTNLKTRAF